MIYGIGTDVCDIRRIRAAWQRRGERFAAHILSDRELAVFHDRLARVESRGMAYLATRFSAKEAFSKAIGLGLQAPMRWRDCAIVNARSGRPELALDGPLADWFAERRLRGHVTLSDERDHVVSFVVVEVGEVDEVPV